MYWGTLTKLCWDVPRATHKYFVSNLLSAGHLSIRAKLIGRYANFFRSLLKSRSEEVSLVANMAGRDKSSTTGINLANIQAETGLSPWTASPADIRDVISDKEDPVPPSDLWRIPFLEKLLLQRHEMQVNCEDTKEINTHRQSLYKLSQVITRL